jgi:signal transduction histidine kinase
MRSATMGPRRNPVKRAAAATSVRQISIRHEERRRLARELHDGVAQSLYGITLSASRVLVLLERSDTAQVHTVVNEMLRLANDSQTELRSLLHDLRSDEFHLLLGGLTGALASQAADLQAREGCEVCVSLADEPDLPTATKATLARIAREALHNIAKHAQARRVDLVLEVGPSDVTLLVTDDGRGFDPHQSHPGHFGLELMHEQAIAVGAALDFVSVPGRGAQIRVRVARGHA